MLNIFICDIDLSFAIRIKSIVENYALIENLAARVVCVTSDNNDILKYLYNNKVLYGLYFLDLGDDIKDVKIGQYIQFDEEKFKLAQNIRKYDPRGFIVFSVANSSMSSFIFEYRVEPLDCINRSDSKFDTLVCECVKDAYTKITIKYSPLQDNFIFKLYSDIKGSFTIAKGSIMSINKSDIFYFETSLDTEHIIILYTSNEQFEFRGKISKIIEEINNKSFVRCQRNLIINLNYVKAVDTVQYKVIFTNNASVEISEKQIFRLAKQFKQYMSEAI